MNRWEKLRDGLILVVGVAMIILMTQIRDEQLDGRQRGYANRAVICRTLKVLNQPIENDPQCNEKPVRELVEATEIRITAAGQTTCAIARANNWIVPEECDG